MKVTGFVNGAFVGFLAGEAGFRPTDWSFWALFALYFAALVVAALIDDYRATSA